MLKINLRSNTWCCVNIYIFFAFINVYDPHFILLYVNINFFIHNYIYFLMLKNTLITFIYSFFSFKKRYMTCNKTSQTYELIFF